MKYQTQARFWVTAEFYALETCFEPRVLQLALNDNISLHIVLLKKFFQLTAELKKR